MVSEWIVGVAVSAIIGVAAAIIDALRERWGPQKLPQASCAQMSETARMWWNGCKRPATKSAST